LENWKVPIVERRKMTEKSLLNLSLIVHPQRAEKLLHLDFGLKVTLIKFLLCPSSSIL
jgi:hypothetical protein